MYTRNQAATVAVNRLIVVVSIVLGLIALVFVMVRHTSAHQLKDPQAAVTVRQIKGRTYFVQRAEGYTGLYPATR